MSESVGVVAEPIAPLSPTISCGEVYNRFSADEDLISLAVVRDGKPIGLVNRHDLLFKLARDYGRALYALKPVTHLMDPEPLVVDADLDIDELQTLIISQRPSALVRGFVVMRNGTYLGICTAMSLLRLTVLNTERRRRELDVARMEAEQASRSKSQFLANMSHELRTPLNAIIGFSEVLQAQLLGPIGDNRYAEYAGDILQSGQHLLAIINDILDMAKIEAGRMELHETEFDPVGAVNATVRIIAEQARLAGVKVALALGTDLPRVRADERALRQVLLNLLSNAIKFTPRGGSATLGAAYSADGELMISVRDTGIGMTPADIERAMIAFGQVNNALNRQTNGTGLGLPLVRALMELHGGRLAIESEPGVGTLAAIFLPPDRIIGPRLRLRA